MSDKIYMNLAVKDLSASKKFFSALGYTFDPEFTSDEGACLVIGENIYAMLLTEKFFKEFSQTDVCDTSKAREVLTAISCDSRREVDEMMKKAIAAGGKAHRPPEDFGFMYGHSFRDLDGHVWEPFYMDPSRPKRSQ